MIIKSKFKEYVVRFESDLSFLQALSKDDNTEYVIDKKVYELYADFFNKIPKARLILIEATEENKVVETALAICEQMTEISAKRNAYLISIGGGIIQDITGFVANVLYRGIAWTFVPTTLLASCDSCIGGKTSLNYKKYKNLLGTFYPPDQIHICPVFFKTLSDRDYESGLGEVVKFNIVSGKDGLEDIENNIDRLLARENETVNRFVHKSLTFKKKFIEEDEFDRGERIKLNFAHTFGHAIETVTDYKIPHGTAVAIGMIMANHVSEQRGLLSKETEAQSKDVLIKVIHIQTDLAQYPMSGFLAAMHKDKKQVGTQLTAVLMTDQKETELKIIHDIRPEEVEGAVNYFEKAYLERI